MPSLKGEKTANNQSSALAKITLSTTHASDNDESMLLTITNTQEPVTDR
jgi:hypothetical protein